MAVVEEALVYLLRTKVPSVQNRVYDTYLPQDVVFPALTYTLLDRPHLKTLAGNSGTYHPRYQIDVYSYVAADIRAAAAAIWGLEGFVGVPVGVNIKWIWVEDESETDNPPQEEDERALRQGTVELTVWYGN